MLPAAIPTGFAELSPRAARIILTISALLAIVCVGITFSAFKSGSTENAIAGPGDIALYRAEVARMHAGEEYYAVAGEELRARGYPTRSVFNWRTPLPMWLIAKLPDWTWGRGILASLSLTTLLGGMVLIGRGQSVHRTFIGMLLLAGALMPCLLGDLSVMPDLWAGVLIALSVTLLGMQWPMCGVLVGVAAMFCRDLAVPYALLSLSLAIYQRKPAEVLAWIVGLLAYAAYFNDHAGQVSLHSTAADLAHPHGWVCWGGLPFVIATVQMNSFCLVLPQWVTALYLVIAVLGFAAWDQPGGKHAAWVAGGYLLMFAVIGQPFNQYWGALIAPLLCLGAAHGPDALADLYRRAFASQSALDVSPAAAAIPAGSARSC